LIPTCVTLLATVGVLGVSGAALGSTRILHSGYFETPSGNIQCDYLFPGRDTYVRCGVRSGLKPPPPKRGPACSRPRWVALFLSGRPAFEHSHCPGEDEGDSGPFFETRADAHPPHYLVLAYGKTFHAGAMTCVSATGGLTCRASSGHGFFLSRALSRRF